MMRQTLIYVTVFLFAGFVLSACGVKPGSVDPPPGAEDTVFPRTYPDPSTDPAP